MCVVALQASFATPAQESQKDRNSSHHHHDAKPNYANPIADIGFFDEPGLGASEFTQNLQGPVVCASKRCVCADSAGAPHGLGPHPLTSISRTVRRWALHHRSDKSLQDLAATYNPCIRGWVTYFSHFYKWQLRPTLKRIDAYVIRWARRKYKRMVHQTKGGRDWFDRLRRANPKLFAHWPLCHGDGRTSGAV